MYANGTGLQQDYAEALKWFQLSAEQGQKDALINLNDMQQHNLIPTPLPGTTVTTVLLTSAKAAQYNNQTGKVVIVPSAAEVTSTAIKPGRVAVLLDGEQHALAFNLKNLRV